MPPQTQANRRPDKLKIGFVPLCDSAPIVMAQELNLFAKYGLQVELQRELGWVSIREKIVSGRLDAAHAVAGLLFSATYGLEGSPSPCVTGIVLNLHGNAITLSRDLWKQGVRDAASLREALHARRDNRKLTFATVSEVSSHDYLLRHWLEAGGIDPGRDVNLAVLPPPQMHPCLRAGHLDGYCVGEPWNSMAIREGTGRCVASSQQLAPGHPEKILMVRKEFANERRDQHRALVAALLEACAFVDNPAHRDTVIRTLARPQYINAPPQVLARSLGSALATPEHAAQPSLGSVFHRHGANEPSADKAAWVYNRLLSRFAASGLDRGDRFSALQLFQTDIYAEACSLVRSMGGSFVDAAELAVSA